MRSEMQQRSESGRCLWAEGAASPGLAALAQAEFPLGGVGCQQELLCQGKACLLKPLGDFPELCYSSAPPRAGTRHCILCCARNVGAEPRCAPSQHHPAER